mmetsp:Transcript_8068/g.25122  ORF Transcript_8068/g.25122 Transcript_8068/m.25122 type:complete len:282 (-) Transcript_8068:113-958(-)
MRFVQLLVVARLRLEGKPAEDEELEHRSDNSGAALVVVELRGLIDAGLCMEVAERGEASDQHDHPQETPAVGQLEAGDCPTSARQDRDQEHGAVGHGGRDHRQEAQPLGAEAVPHVEAVVCQEERAGGRGRRTGEQQELEVWMVSEAGCVLGETPARCPERRQGRQGKESRKHGVDGDEACMVQGDFPLPAHPVVYGMEPVAHWFIQLHVAGNNGKVPEARPQMLADSNPEPEVGWSDLHGVGGILDLLCARGSLPSSPYLLPMLWLIIEEHEIQLPSGRG